MSGIASTNLVCFDTSLFIYFFEQNPQFYQTSKLYFQKLEKGSIKAATTILTLIEILSYKNLVVPEGKVIAEFYDTPNLTIIEVNREISIEAARIRREYKFKLADSIQLSTAKYARAKTFITNDDSLKRFKELKVILLTEIKP